MGGLPRDDNRVYISTYITFPLQFYTANVVLLLQQQTPTSITTMAYDETFALSNVLL